MVVVVITSHIRCVKFNLICPDPCGFFFYIIKVNLKKNLSSDDIGSSNDLMCVCPPAHLAEPPLAVGKMSRFFFPSSSNRSESLDVLEASK